MNRPTVIVVAILGFSLVGMFAAHLDKGWSPIVGAFGGGLIGLLVAVFAIAGEKWR